MKEGIGILELLIFRSLRKYCLKTCVPTDKYGYIPSLFRE